LAAGWWYRWPPAGAAVLARAAFITAVGGAGWLGNGGNGLGAGPASEEGRATVALATRVRGAGLGGGDATIPQYAQWRLRRRRWRRLQGGGGGGGYSGGGGGDGITAAGGGGGSYIDPSFTAPC